MTNIVLCLDGSKKIFETQAKILNESRCKVKCICNKCHSSYETWFWDFIVRQGSVIEIGYCPRCLCKSATIKEILWEK